MNFSLIPKRVYYHWLRTRLVTRYTELISWDSTPDELNPSDFEADELIQELKEWIPRFSDSHAFPIENPKTGAKGVYVDDPSFPGGWILILKETER